MLLTNQGMWHRSVSSWRYLLSILMEKCKVKDPPVLDCINPLTAMKTCQLSQIIFRWVKNPLCNQTNECMLQTALTREKYLEDKLILFKNLIKKHSENLDCSLLIKDLQSALKVSYSNNWISSIISISLLRMKTLVFLKKYTLMRWSLIS